jgi:hypothetical protein
MRERERNFAIVADRSRTFMTVSDLKKVSNGGKRSWKVQERLGTNSGKRSRYVRVHALRTKESLQIFTTTRYKEQIYHVKIWH